MDLDSRYYSSRCKDIHCLWLFKAVFFLGFWELALVAPTTLPVVFVASSLQL
jgi:hypothetical protein